MQKIKKLSIYDLNPRFFSDTTGNGVGDLLGLAKKFDYFKFLGVDAIILQDILATHSSDEQQDFMSVSKQIGDINDLKQVVKLARRLDIKLFIEMNIGTISENHEWFKDAIQNVEMNETNIVEFSKSKDEIPMDSKYSETANVFFPINEATQEIPLNWGSDKTNDRFVEVVKFWGSIGIEGFVFKDFEFIGDKTKHHSMNETTLKELRKFYRTIKEVDDNILVIGKSDIVELKDADSYTSGATKVFDYFQSTKISKLGISSKHGKDALGKFSVKDLVKDLHKFGLNPANIVSFGSENIGRFITRWGDEGQYINESAKAFALLSLLNPASSTIYYGDELGAANIGLTHLDDFQDDNLEMRKSDMAAMKVSEKDFMNAQVLQNPINSRSLMMWNNSKNGGFSSAEKTITPPSVEYHEKNIEIQYADKDSILNFYREIIRIINKSDVGTIIEKGNSKSTTKVAVSGVARLTSIYGSKKLTILVNTTDIEKKLLLKPKNGKVLLSTYADKKYDELPKRLQAYEGIVIYEYADSNESKTNEAPTIEPEVKEVKVEKINEAEKIKQLNAEVEQMKNEEVRRELGEIKTQSVELSTVEETKLNAQAEKQARENALESAKDEFSIMKEDIDPSEVTKLTEDEIAETTQIDIDDVDDIDEFLSNLN